MNYDKKKYPILSTIETPTGLRQLPQKTLLNLSYELRQFLLDSVSQSSGHLASGLGTIELTIALHYVYNTPFDLLIWDVGHQAYPHKILTGRRDLIFEIRKKNGLHPFPCRKESNYDPLSVGHSSTSISAGLGMAVAAKNDMSKRHTVCIIGDGAITAGMAFEAMNHAGGTEYDILVILNDNKMSISKNVGALNNHLAQNLSKQHYSHLHTNNTKTLSYLMTAINKINIWGEKNAKNIISSYSLFKKLGFNYIGPINGHDITILINILKKIQNLKGPKFLHIITKKGYGYHPAENDPINWHAVPKFDPIAGILPKKKIQSPILKYSATGYAMLHLKIKN